MENNEEKKQIQLTKNDLIINRRLSKLFSLINKYEELSKKGTWLYKLLLGVLLIATAIIIYALFTTNVIASVISNINNQKNVSIVEIALAFFLPLLNIIATGLFYFETNYCTSKIDTNNKISPEKKPSSIANSPNKIAAIIPIVFEIESGV